MNPGSATATGHSIKQFNKSIPYDANALSSALPIKVQVYDDELLFFLNI